MGKINFLVPFLCLILLTFVHCTPYRSKEGCSVCGRKVDKNRPFVDIPAEEDERALICETFGLNHLAPGQICSACARAIRRYKSSGVKAPTVSRIKDI